MILKREETESQFSMGYFVNLYQRDAIERSEDIGSIEFDQKELESVFEQVTDIQIPEGEPEIKEMTGSSLDEAVREEPITANVDLSEVLKTSSGVIAGVSIPNPYIRGLVILLLFASIALPNEEPIRADQALTYGIAWDLSEEGVLPVQKDELLESVSEKSHTTAEVNEIDKQTVARCIDELDDMGCITTENSSDGVLIWLNEKFSVDYQV